MIDYWLLFNVIVLAVIMLWHTYVARVLASSEAEAEANKSSGKVKKDSAGGM